MDAGRDRSFSQVVVSSVAGPYRPVAEEKIPSMIDGGRFNEKPGDGSDERIRDHSCIESAMMRTATSSAKWSVLRTRW
jgi:hypothetical protein